MCKSCFCNRQHSTCCWVDFTLLIPYLFTTYNMQDVQWNSYCSPSRISYGFINGPFVIAHERTKTHHHKRKRWCQHWKYQLFHGFHKHWWDVFIHQLLVVWQKPLLCIANCTILVHSTKGPQLQKHGTCFCNEQCTIFLKIIFAKCHWSCSKKLCMEWRWHNFMFLRFLLTHFSFIFWRFWFFQIVPW
jgi:hypothetical protein